MDDPRRINLPDGSAIDWSINPSLDPTDTKFKLEWNKRFPEDDVQITVRINGEVMDLISGPNSDDFRVDFQAVRRF